jgi:hypothetical protein
MEENKKYFGKNNIVNRFIAVKYAEIPKSTPTSWVIKPLNDGLGFLIRL